MGRIMTSSGGPINYCFSNSDSSYFLSLRWEGEGGYVTLSCFLVQLFLLIMKPTLHWS